MSNNVDYWLKISDENIEGPRFLLTWVSMVDSHISRVLMSRQVYATSAAAHILNDLLTAGWLPPNGPKSHGASTKAAAAQEVADLVWRSTTCPEEEAAGIQALTLEALQRYRKLST